MRGRYTIAGETSLRDERDAVADLASQIRQDEMAGVIFFCSSEYDLARLGKELESAFPCSTVGCTTAGEIGTRYQTDGIVGVSFASETFRFHPIVVEGLQQFSPLGARALAQAAEAELEFGKAFDPEKMFGLLLVDGLSVMEEKVTATLYAALNGVPIIGGSAGDSLKFQETSVYHNGEFRPDRAVLTLIETTLPFKPFKLQHFVPSDVETIVTEAEPAKRIVYELDGGPAAEEYAALVGVDVSQLDSEVFAMNPVMLEIGDEWYVRSIQQANDDGSLTFYCAIEDGLVLTIGKGVGIVDTLRKHVADLEAELGKIELTLGCDCILRRLEINETHSAEKMEAELAKIGFVGFSTFGEQYDAVHINQTLTGVAFGRASSHGTGREPGDV